MAHGQLTLERERAGRLVNLGIRFFLSAALTAGQTAGGAAPFALGWVSAAGPGAEGLAALAGAFAGAALFLPFVRALPFLAVAVLIVTASAALGGTWLLSRSGHAALAAVGLYVTVEGIYILQSLSPLERLADCLAASALLGASALLFRPLLRGGEGREIVDGLVFLAGALGGEWRTRSLWASPRPGPCCASWRCSRPMTGGPPGARPSAWGWG